MLHPGPTPVRLTQEEKSLIRDGIEKVFKNLGVSCEEISLFGSRTQMNAKGGDIDLYIRFKPTSKPLDEWGLKAKIKIALNDLLGEQKIDIVLDDMQKDLGAFGKLIQNQKVELWKKN
mgnify:CR=1 FL=1